MTFVEPLRTLATCTVPSDADVLPVTKGYKKMAKCEIPEWNNHKCFLFVFTFEYSHIVIKQALVKLLLRDTTIAFGPLARPWV